MDTNEGVSTTRFIYITWIGESVSGIMNARIGVNKTSVTSVIGHYSIEVVISNKSELSDENIIDRAKNTTGSNSKVLNTGSSNGGGRAPYTGGVSSFVPKSASKEVSINDEDSAKAINKDIRTGKSGLNWMLMSYTNNNQLSVVSKGNGGITELRTHLKLDTVAYAFISVDDKIDATEMKRFVYVRWVPENVPSMLKGRLTSHRGYIEDWYAPYHLNINASELNEITSQVIIEKLKQMKS